MPRSRGPSPTHTSQEGARLLSQRFFGRVVSFSFDVNTNSNASDSNKQITPSARKPAPRADVKKKIHQKNFFIFSVEITFSDAIIFSVKYPMNYKALNVSLPVELHNWVKSRCKNGGIEVPVSRVVAHAIQELKNKEERKKK